MIQLDILVVDDEINIRKTLSLFMESRGHRVTAVSNTGDATKEKPVCAPSISLSSIFGSVPKTDSS